MYIVENLAINGTTLSANATAADTTITVNTPGNLSAGLAYIWDKATPAGETVTIAGIVGSTVTLTALANSYTVLQNAVITMAAGILANGTIVEFDIRISARWAKVGYVKIVQLQPGAMDVKFDLFERSGVDESLRNNLIYNVYRRNIELTVVQGGQYGESLMGAPIPYKDRDPVDEERTYSLHCRLINEVGGTASDFAVLIKLADIGEVTG